ncbi:MAG: ABC transporter substrate-binding protein [Thermodesulfobacteriota bacterium]|nr:ABC transporter substrate-binding protein [Thermodesulfobacteriota bacterium]
MSLRPWAVIVALAIILTVGGGSPGTYAEQMEDPDSSTIPIGMAVEFMDHAACAFVAREMGWYKQEGLNISVYESYVTGMALAAAFARGDIQVAYMCLVPAINLYANARVPIKIVAGTHKYGYGLVINPEKIKTVKDLENPDIRTGCVGEGGAVDVIMLNKMIDEYHIDKEKISKNIRRMSPPKQVVAIIAGKLDAAFLPEQWATMAEELGCQMLLTSRDVWPEVQGSVLVVKEDLLHNHPEIVRKLVKVTKKATDWIRQNPDSAAGIVARHLSCARKRLMPTRAGMLDTNLHITPQTISRSMKRMVITTDLEPDVVQDMIDYMVSLGYIRAGFKAGHVLYLNYLYDE